MARKARGEKSKASERHNQRFGKSVSDCYFCAAFWAKIAQNGRDGHRWRSSRVLDKKCPKRFTLKQTEYCVFGNSQQFGNQLLTQG
jgi:hypothetical protein